MTSTATERRASTAAVVAALLTVYIVWGSTYLAIAIMIETLPPLLAVGIRYVSAGLILFAFLAARARLRRGTERERPTAIQWRSAFIIGALLLLGGNGGVVLGELYIDSGIAAVLIAMVPIWLAIFDAAITRRRPSRLVVAGLVAGIVGVAILLVPIEGVPALDVRGVGLVLFAAIAWAAGSLYARHAPLPRSGLLGTGMEMLAGGVVILAAGTLAGEVGRTNVSEFSMNSILAVAYLIVFGSVLAFSAYTWLLAHVPVSTVATYAYVNPVVAVALGAVFRAEAITLRTLIASAVILGAVIAMISGRPRQAAPEPDAVPDAPQPRGSPQEAADG